LFFEGKESIYSARNEFDKVVMVGGITTLRSGGGTGVPDAEANFTFFSKKYAF